MLEEPEEPGIHAPNGGDVEMLGVPLQSSEV